VEAFLLPEGHLITHWVEGRHWPVDEFRTPANVRRLTETAKHIHALPPNGAVFSAFRRVEIYLKAARELAVEMPAGLDSLLMTMQAIETDQQTDPSDWLKLCHNDLVCVNYLFCEKEQCIKVLDWEFAGLGDVYYDLATIVYTHDSDGPIPTELEEEMLACYFGAVSIQQRRRLLGMKYMLMLFSALWGLVQAGMQHAGRIDAPQDFDYLEFAQYLLAHDVCDLQKQYHAG
jgi:thiamine kinase-like enzyme